MATSPTGQSGRSPAATPPDQKTREPDLRNTPRQRPDHNPLSLFSALEPPPQAPPKTPLDQPPKSDTEEEEVPATAQELDYQKPVPDDIPDEFKSYDLSKHAIRDRLEARGIGIFEVYAALAYPDYVGPPTKGRKTHEYRRGDIAVWADPKTKVVATVIDLMGGEDGEPSYGLPKRVGKRKPLAAPIPDTVNLAERLGKPRDISPRAGLKRLFASMKPGQSFWITDLNEFYADKFTTEAVRSAVKFYVNSGFISPHLRDGYYKLNGTSAAEVLASSLPRQSGLEGAAKRVDVTALPLAALRATAMPDMQLIQLTPDLAAKFLADKQTVRAARKEHVDFLAREILAGNWQITHQGLAFRLGDGAMIDGQHRCMAVIAAEIGRAHV